jgi:phosphoglycolate phosphatase-like HAD superfamily hydrolase
MTHVIWDWNGTLVDDHDVVIESVNAVMAAYDGPPVTSETYLDRYHRPVHRFYEYLLGMSITDDHWHRIDSIFNDHYHSRLHAVPLAPNAEQALASVARLGHTQSLLSMWRHDLVTREAGRHGIASWFQRIEGNRTRSGDPKSVSLRLHLEALDLIPSDVTMIGDTLDDFDAAAAIGARIILVTGSQNPDKLRATGAPVVDSLTEAITHLPA